MKAYRIQAQRVSGHRYLLAADEAAFRRTSYFHFGTLMGFEEVPLSEALPHVISQAAFLLAPEDIQYPVPKHDRGTFTVIHFRTGEGEIVLILVVRMDGTFGIESLPIGTPGHFAGYLAAWKRAANFIMVTGLVPADGPS